MTGKRLSAQYVKKSPRSQNIQISRQILLGNKAKCHRPLFHNLLWMKWTKRTWNHLTLLYEPIEDDYYHSQMQDQSLRGRIFFCCWERKNPFASLCLCHLLKNNGIDSYFWHWPPVNWFPLLPICWHHLFMTCRGGQKTVSKEHRLQKNPCCHTPIYLEFSGQFKMDCLPQMLSFHPKSKTIELFAYYGRSFYYPQLKKKITSSTKIVPVALIFVSK